MLGWLLRHMDTLVIVRRIREAETLADKGSHGEAMRLLEPLLGEAALQEAHRTLIRKKLELFEKQRARVTRIMTRSASSSSGLTAISAVRRPAADSDKSSELTAIRKPVDPATERPTDVPLDKTPPGVPTEAVPKLQSRGNSAMLRKPGVAVPGHDTELGQRDSTEVEARPVSSGQTTVHMPPPRSPDSTVLMPGPARPSKPDPNESQELAPLAEDPIAEEHGDDDPRSTSIFALPPSPVVVDQVIQPRPESAPNLVRVSTPQEETKTPPPAPRAAASVDNIPAPAPVPVRDSIVMPHTHNVIPTPAPGPPRPRVDDDSTYLLADDHFAARPPSRKPSQSTPDLKALVDRLPDDDLRRELALEVVRLREELEKSRRGAATQDSPSRRVERVKPESGTFHIPASQANTIVRRAAGSDRIEVHMPSRDEDIAELQVLRRDSVRGKKSEVATDRVALAQDYIEARQARGPGRLKAVARWLGVAAAVAFLAWLIHLGWKTVTQAEALQSVVTETTVGAIELGISTEDAPALAGASREPNRQVLVPKGSSWVVQYGTIDGVERVLAIVVPLQGGDPGVTAVEFGARTLRLADGTGVAQVISTLGEPDPAYSEAVFRSKAEGVLVYKDRQGRSTLEFRYRSAEPERAVALRLLDARATPPFPDLASGR